MKFTQIHVHSDFSVLDGYGMVGEYAAKAASLGMKSLVITDHGMGAAFPQLIEETAKHGIKPVFGCEVYTNQHNNLIPSFSGQTDDMKKRIRRAGHIILIAKNDIGYKNLIKIISMGWIDGFYYKPRVSFDDIEANAEGLICTTACIGSEPNRKILDGDRAGMIQDLLRLKGIFGDDLFLEMELLRIPPDDDPTDTIIDHDLQVRVNKELILASRHMDIPLVVANDCHYAEREDSFNHKLMLIINSKGTLSNPGKFEFHTDQLWFKSEAEMDETWERDEHNLYMPRDVYEQAKANTSEICSRCDVEVDTTPKFPVMPGAKEKMLEGCLEAMKRKGFYDNAEYRKRLVKEYDLICEKGFESYFIICRMIVDHAKSNGWLVGPGRGSGAGSLICYLLGITGVDPIKHNLIFERFLSASRGGVFANLQFKDEDEIVA